MGRFTTWPTSLHITGHFRPCPICSLRSFVRFRLPSPSSTLLANRGLWLSSHPRPFCPVLQPRAHPVRSVSRLSSPRCPGGGGMTHGPRVYDGCPTYRRGAAGYGSRPRPRLRAPPRRPVIARQVMRLEASGVLPSSGERSRRLPREVC